MGAFLEAAVERLSPHPALDDASEPILRD